MRLSLLSVYFLQSVPHVGSVRASQSGQEFFEALKTKLQAMVGDNCDYDGKLNSVSIADLITEVNVCRDLLGTLTDNLEVLREAKVSEELRRHSRLPQPQEDFVGNVCVGRGLDDMSTMAVREIVSTTSVLLGSYMASPTYRKSFLENNTAHTMALATLRELLGLPEEG